ncbi:thiamine phosphate synthase [Salinicoccus carnicancri]|uniref:thiamine phosphate synthase n=1 Tax=Salinicoccus carnicancri TaxID=558170 RepID=UPI0002E9F138|nr:thiamine phosphate synthase [Salinicoccus carnicancri]
MNGQLHLISNGNFSKQHLDILLKIYDEIDYFHLREKKKSAAELLEILNMLEAGNMPLHKVIINDRIDISLMKKCAGVQLAYHSAPSALVRKSFPEIMIGQSIHSLEEAKGVSANDIDFLVYGHIFESRSKVGKTPKGMHQLNSIIDCMPLPVIAIGGITPGRAEAVINAGAAGIAVMSGIWQADDPVKAVRDYGKALKGDVIER